MKTALLVIDTQQALVDANPVRKDEFLLNVNMLIDAAHTGKTTVIYVRHDSGPNDVLEAGTPGWQLERSLSPRNDERIFEKRFGSAFKQTGLPEFLKENEIERLVVCGMQTEYCIDTSVKAAFEHGFQVVIPSGATTTYANPFLSGEKIIQYYEKMIWGEPLANVVSVEEAIHLLKA